METAEQRQQRIEKEKPDPQASDKKAPGREKQPEGSKRLTVMFRGIAHVIEVQPGSLTTDVVAQVLGPPSNVADHDKHRHGSKLSKAEGGDGIGFKPTDKIFDYVNDTDTLYLS
jgi:hypothetical protein